MNQTHRSTPTYTNSCSDTESLLRKSASSVGLLISFQIASHALTFFLNTVIIRKIDHSLYGFSTVQLQLVVSAILFISREAIRNVCQRTDVTQQGGRDQVAWLSWMAIPIGVAIKSVVIFGTYYTSSSEELAVVGYSRSVSVIAIAAFMELLIEPVYIRLSLQLDFRSVVVVESVSLIVQCGCTILLLSVADIGAATFAYARVAYASTMVIGYYILWCIVRKYRFSDLLPALNTWRFILPALKKTTPFWVQSTQMWLLSEGQRVVMKMVLALDDQAKYSLVSNLGSLPVRILLRPIENVCGVYFSKHVVLGVIETRLRFQQTQRLMILIAMIFIAFGPAYSSVLIHLLYSNYNDSDTSRLLSVFFVYVGLMGLNGVMEVFVRSVANDKSIRQHNMRLLPHTVLHLILSYFMCWCFGSLGLIVAECVDMVVRIYSSHHFATEYFAENDDTRYSARRMVPSAYSFMVIFVAALCCNISAYRVLDFLVYKWVAVHVVIGVVSIGCTVYAITHIERDSIRMFHIKQK